VAVGRPRAFDIDEALDRALRVFWRKGYEGTTLLDLTEAMGINRPSLYAAFGNKEELFRKALDRYAEGPKALLRAAIGQPTARATAERLLRGTADSLTNPENPPGCLAVHGALSCGEAAEPIRHELNRCRAESEAALRDRFERAKSEGDLPPGAEPADLARYVATVVQGMAVQAAAGAARDDLQRVVEMALRAWENGADPREREAPSEPCR
jgi:AcrR family transcriptional regulator